MHIPSVMPTLSVIVPAYNRERTISATLDSILACGSAAEIIVVDDGSTDGTADVVRRYSGRVVLAQQENGGPARARNRGLSQAAGEIIAFLDSDDLWQPGVIPDCLSALNDHSGIEVLVCDTLYGNESQGYAKLSASPGYTRFERLLNNPLGPNLYALERNAFVAAMIDRNQVFLGSVLFRREALESGGGFDPELFGGEDYELCLRYSATHRFAFYSRVLTRYEKHAGGISANLDRMAHEFTLTLSKFAQSKDITAAERASAWTKYRALAFGYGYRAYDRGDYQEARRASPAVSATAASPRSPVSTISPAFFRDLSSTPAAASGRGCTGEHSEENGLSAFRILLVKESQNWPRVSGTDVHGYSMIQALSARGHAVSLATMSPPSEKALEGLTLESLHILESSAREPLPLTAVQQRFVKYYGVNTAFGAALSRLVRERGFNVVVMVARQLLALLCNVKGPVRVWYPADDPAWHHLTRVKLLKPGTWGELLKSHHERRLRTRLPVVLRSRVGRVAGGPTSLSRVFGMPRRRPHAQRRRCGVLPAGKRGQPSRKLRLLGSTRLRPEPGCAGVVHRPRLAHHREADSRRAPLGLRHQSAAALRDLVKTPGIELHADVPDLRPEVTRRQVAVFPFVTGSGIKNKLLEAAALGMPIVCTRRALTGTRGQPPVVVCRTSREWAETLARLWSSPDERHKLGAAARAWVTEHHTWDSAAQTAERGIEESLRPRA